MEPLDHLQDIRVTGDEAVVDGEVPFYGGWALAAGRAGHRGRDRAPAPVERR